VIKRIAVGDAYVLPYAKREDMGCVAAVALVKGCGNRWGLARVGIAGRNVHQNVLERIARPGDDVFC
jgi:hypothetical protein